MLGASSRLLRSIARRAICFLKSILSSCHSVIIIFFFCFLSNQFSKKLWDTAVSQELMRGNLVFCSRFCITRRRWSPLLIHFCTVSKGTKSLIHLVWGQLDSCYWKHTHIQCAPFISLHVSLLTTHPSTDVFYLYKLACEISSYLALGSAAVPMWVLILEICLSLRRYAKCLGYAFLYKKKV